MKERTGVITFQGTPLTLLGEEIIVGAQAPSFTAVNTELAPISLDDYAGKVRVLSVMPSVDTPVCANQTRMFNKEAASMKDVVVLTLSVDLPFALGRFCAAEGIENAVTLSDYKELDFGLKYGFVLKELRLLSRGVVVVDRDGVVRYVEYVKEVTDDPDFAAAVEAIRKVL